VLQEQGLPVSEVASAQLSVDLSRMRWLQVSAALPERRSSGLSRTWRSAGSGSREQLVLTCPGGHSVPF